MFWHKTTNEPWWRARYFGQSIMLRNTFTVLIQVLLFNFHTPLSGTVVHINAKLKLIANSECTYSTETAFCTKEEKDAQVNNCYFLVLQDFTLISLCYIREPHTRATEAIKEAQSSSTECTHTLTLHKLVSSNG